MKYTLTRIDPDAPVERYPQEQRQTVDDPLAQQATRGIMIGRLEGAARHRQLGPQNSSGLQLGISCCCVEMCTAFTSPTTWLASALRFEPPPSGRFHGDCRHPFIKMAPVIQRLYEQLLEPKWVISMGACANSGGMYDIYSVLQGVDKFLPVDVYIPGCPPRPEAFLQALMLLQVHRQNAAPLLGGGSVYRPQMQSEKERKRGERINVTNLRTPDEIDHETDSRIPKQLHHGTVANRRSRRCPGGRRAVRPLRCRALHRRAPVPACRSSGSPGSAAGRDGLLQSCPSPFVMLFDLSATDERMRSHRHGLPESDFTVFYHLISIDRNADVMLKVALGESDLHLPTVSRHFPNANWYEREVWDLMGITFDGHPHLTRIMMPKELARAPLRKDYPARATEFDPFMLDAVKAGSGAGQPAVQTGRVGHGPRQRERGLHVPEPRPNHPPPTAPSAWCCNWTGKRSATACPTSAITTAAPRRWASASPGTATSPYRPGRIPGRRDEQPALCAGGRKLAGIKVPARVDMIRVMMAELFRIQSHLLFLGTYIQDVGP